MKMIMLTVCASLAGFSQAFAIEPMQMDVQAASRYTQAEDPFYFPPEPGSAAASAARNASISRLGLATFATVVVVPAEVIKLGAVAGVLEHVAEDSTE